jgi:hypothetical protein
VPRVLAVLKFELVGVSASRFQIGSRSILNTSVAWIFFFFFFDG